MINYDVLLKTYTELFEYKLKNALPPDYNFDHIKELFIFLNRFYATNSIEKIDTIFAVILCDDDLSSYGLDKMNAIRCNIGNIHKVIQFPSKVQLMSNNEAFVWNNFNDDLSIFSALPIPIYKYTPVDESIYIGDKKILAPASGTFSKSIFALPTFLDLEETLDNYYRDYAKFSICKIIQTAWHDKKRLLWNAAPESILRDSLWQYIRATLRISGDILREQNVTDENPIDIKITWQNTSERALIEIKWLGISVDSSGKKTSSYSNSRIKSGSKQLIDYIDTAIEQTTDAYFKGYLVVFDGRRRMVDSPEKLERHKVEDSIYYRNISNNEQLVDEFIEKKCLYKRFFMEPVISERNYSS